jgi:hypothetical protein
MKLKLGPSFILANLPTSKFPLVQDTLAIAIVATVLEARIIVDTAPAIIRTLLLPAATTVVRSAETSALSRVDVAALVWHVADLVGAT